MTAKFDVVYARVSSRNQHLRSQMPDLKRFVESSGRPTRWFTDKVSAKNGGNMRRDAWQALEAMITAGKVGRIIVWRLDRLGRCTRQLATLVHTLQNRGITLISIREGLDLSTASGRLMIHVLSSIAEYETELRGERVRAGQQAARAAGKTWGGSTRGRRLKVTDEHIKVIQRMKSEGVAIAKIARTLSLSRQTVYTVLREVANGKT